MGSTQSTWGVWKNHGDCTVVLTPALLAVFCQKCRHKLVPTNIFDIPAVLQMASVDLYKIFDIPAAPCTWQPKYQCGQLFKKPGDFDENINITKDQVDVKSQNQLNLFFETKNLFKKRMWEANGWDAIPIVFWSFDCNDVQKNKKMNQHNQIHKHKQKQKHKQKHKHKQKQKNENKHKISNTTQQYLHKH